MMQDSLPIVQPQRIKDCGFDEYWLQDQIANNPSCLGLGVGELDLVAKEKKQSSGGRLDILVKDPQDDTMYEVEVMLGETNESHIIRTIEYWDNEKRKWPKRQHIAVLVAESITRRFFNVIQLLSNVLPIVAIQVSIVEINGHKALNFSKILDIYEEPEDSEDILNEIHDEEFWRLKAPWTLDAAKVLVHITLPIYDESASLSFVKHYIALRVGENNYFSFHKRNANKSQLSFWLSDELIDKATTLLDASKISYVRKTHLLRLTTDKATIEASSEVIRQIAALVKESWQS